METELQTLWENYNWNQLQEGITALFPDSTVSLEIMLHKIWEGDIVGAFRYLTGQTWGHMGAQLTGLRNIFIWLLIVGLISAILTYFIDLFEKHQIAELGFYYVYLLLSAVLLKCFAQILSVANQTMENIILFIKLMMPVYLATIGIANGTTSVNAYSQLLLLIIYGVEHILLGLVMTLINSYMILQIVNCIWPEEKLQLLITFLEKIVGWILKTAIGIVTGVSIFQSVITPMIDSVKVSALQKTISALPGIGNMADGAVELVMGSALVIRNSVGIVLLIILLVMCGAPLLRIFLTALLCKGAAALMGIVSDKRITECTNRMGDAMMMVLRTTATALLLFLITLAVVASSAGNG